MLVVLAAGVVAGGLYCVLGDARADDRAIYELTPDKLRTQFGNADGWVVVFASRPVSEQRWSSKPTYFIGIQRQ